MKQFLAALVVAGVCAAERAQAQTNDHLFRSWRFALESGSARAAGWGGLTVAVPDDGAGALSNPAVLTTLTRIEVFATGARFGSGSAPVGDSLATATTFGTSGAAGRLSGRWAVALLAQQPRRVRIDVLPIRLADGSADLGSLSVLTTDLAVALSFRATERLHVGASLVRTELRVEGQSRHDLADGTTDLRVHSDSRAGQLGGGFGVFYALGRGLSLGFATQAGTRHALERSADSPLLGVVFDPGSAYELVRPASLAGGVQWRLSPRLALGAQLDLVRYSEVAAALVIAQGARSRDEYRLGDALEPHLGAELSFPLRGLSVQVRAGLHAQAEGQLRFVGDDLAEGSAFVGGRNRVSGAVGASLAFAAGFRLDTGARFGGERPAVLFSVTGRF